MDELTRDEMGLLWLGAIRQAQEYRKLAQKYSDYRYFVGGKGYADDAQKWHDLFLKTYDLWEKMS